MRYTQFRKSKENLTYLSKIQQLRFNEPFLIAYSLYFLWREYFVT